MKFDRCNERSGLKSDCSVDVDVQARSRTRLCLVVPEVQGAGVEASLVEVRGPTTGVVAPAERILRTLPDWFGIEESLLEYARNTSALPTFVAEGEGRIVGFLSLRRHFRSSWEIDCIAVESQFRNRGVGRKLLTGAEAWLREQGAQVLQVKTLADSHPSVAYAESRGFYRAVGYAPLQVLPDFWGKGLSVLLLAKSLEVEAQVPAIESP